jgi:maleylacetoacetate isomerase
MKVTVFTYWRSSSAYRVRIALAYKKVEFEPTYVNLLEGAQLSPDYRKNNPSGFVPCLRIGERTVVESVAILELLEDLYPAPPLYPEDPWARARVRALVETINAGTQPLQNLSVLKHLGGDEAARAAWARHFIARGLAAFEGHMERHAAEGVVGPFACGETLSAADCFLVPQLYNARRYKVDLTPYPRLLAAEGAALATPAVQAARPENQGDARNVSGQGTARS